MSINTKKYITKDGKEKIYKYNTNKYDEKRNKTIYNLQKRKTYYKKKGDIEKVHTLELMIDIEKRKINGEE